jgi:McrBC 5-methylcytosine restriction system component
MIPLNCLPHDRLELGNDEIGALQDLTRLPWAEAGVARPIPTRLGVELRIGPYVGRLVIPGRLIIDIGEPYPGTVATCVELTAAGRRGGSQASPGSLTAVSPWSAVAMRFQDELTIYIRNGIERRYIPQTVTMSRPRGRLDIPATVSRLLSRGRDNHVICRPRFLVDDTPFNRVIFAAAVRAEQLLLREGISAPLRGIRAAAMALSGVRRDIVPDIYSARQLVAFERKNYQQLLSLAEILVRGVPALPPNERQDVAYSMSAWINVELLFEEAVRSAATLAAGSRAVVRQGRGDGVNMFQQLLTDPATPMKSANPDVVVHHERRTFLLDAKYRRHDEAFTDGELYQLMAHSVAYEASAAALVAPSRHKERLGEHWIGRDRTGVALYVILVDPTSREGMYRPIHDWVARQLTLQ